MPDPLLYLKAMGVAAISSLGFVLVMARVRRSATALWLNSVSLLGIGLGLTLGYHVMSLQLAWPPANGLDRLLTVVVPLTLGIEFIAGFPSVPRKVAWLLRGSLAAALPRILLHGSVYLSGINLTGTNLTGINDNWSVWQAGATLTICAALLASCWGLLSWLTQRSGGISIPFALLLATQCAGLTVMMAGYIKGGAAAFPFIATVAATTIGAKLITHRGGTPANFAMPATLGISVVGLFGLLFIGRFFGRLSTGSALLMLFAPVLCWATELPQLRRRSPWLVGILRLVLVAIPLALVLAAAKRDFDRDMAPLLVKVQESSFHPLRQGRPESTVPNNEI